MRSAPHLVVLLLVLLPYVSPGLRFPTEVQPWAAALAWFILLAYLALRPSRGLSKQDAYLLIVTGMLALYVRPDMVSGLSQYIRKSLAFVFSVSVYFVAKRLKVREVGWAVSVAVLAYLSFSVLQYLANPAYTALISFLVPVAPQFGGGRGASSLSPEATDFGFTGAYLFVLLLICIRSRTRSNRLWLVALLGAAACVVMSKSGSGVITLVLILGLLSLQVATKTRLLGRTSAVGLTIVICAGSYLLFEQLVQIRGVQLLVMMVTTPQDLMDTSFVYRFVHNWVGLIGLVESRGLGFGAGSFATVAPGLYNVYGIGAGLGLSEYYLSAVYRTLAQYPAGVIPMLMLEYGALGLFYVGIIAWIVVRSSIPHKPIVGLLLLLSWLQSFPVAYPPFWLLLGLCTNEGFRGISRPAEGS